ncbi:MAG: hypothetical protein GY845_20655 [Planctomycetes bacterium]|nr:hypothetical protein [Planctomycetota bacterium]
METSKKAIWTQQQILLGENTMSLFGKPKIEKVLEERYVPMLQLAIGSMPEAKKAFRVLLEKIKRESKEQGTSTLPLNFGDILLTREKHTYEIKCMLARKRKEGLTDDDIRWWWNMHDLERRAMMEVDDMHRYALFNAMIDEEGCCPEEAERTVRKHFPMYGDPLDTKHGDGDDRPLFPELKHRINMYTERRYDIDQDKFRQEAETSSSLNALIRAKIRKGLL